MVSWEDIAPEWVKSLKVLAGLSAAGVALTQNPMGFFKAFVLETALEWVLGGAGEIGAIILELWTILVYDVIVAGGVALLSPFGPVGDLILEGLRGLGDLINEVTAGLGPAAPFVAVLAWSAVTLAVAFGLAQLRKYGPRVLAWVIPWL